MVKKILFLFILVPLIALSLTVQAGWFEAKEKKNVSCELTISEPIGLSIQPYSKELQKQLSSQSWYDATLSWLKDDDPDSNAIIIGTSLLGTSATAIAITASPVVVPSVMVAISATGGAVGGVIGGIIGSGIGWASAGTAIAATIPLAKLGAVTGASLAANLVSALGLAATTPVWATTVAVAGGIIAIAGAGVLSYRYFYGKSSGGISGYTHCEVF